MTASSATVILLTSSNRNHFRILFQFNHGRSSFVSSHNQPIPRSDEPCEMILTLILLSPITLKIRASTPVLPSKPLPSRFTKATFSRTESVLIPSLLELK
jgi:hypothetical protein